MYYVLSLAKNDSIVVSIIHDPNEPDRRGLYDKYQLNGSQKDALFSILRRDTSVGGRSLVHAEIAFCRVQLLDSKSVCVGKILVYGRGSREIELTNIVRSGIPVSESPPSSPGEYSVGRRLRQ